MSWDRASPTMVTSWRWMQCCFRITSAGSEFSRAVRNDSGLYASVVLEDPRTGGRPSPTQSALEAEDAEASTGAANNNRYNLWSNGNSMGGCELEIRGDYVLQAAVSAAPAMTASGQRWSYGSMGRPSPLPPGCWTPLWSPVRSILMWASTAWRWALE